MERLLLSPRYAHLPVILGDGIIGFQEWKFKSLSGRGLKNVERLLWNLIGTTIVTCLPQKRNDASVECGQVGKPCCLGLLRRWPLVSFIWQVNVPKTHRAVLFGMVKMSGHEWI